MLMNLRNDTASGAAQPHTESAPPYGRTYQAGSSPEKALVKSLCEQCSQQAARLNPPQAANRFSSFEVSKKRACRKASPAFAHVSLKIGSSIPRIGQKHGANHRKGLCRQFLPALAAPACEHVAAVGGAHALAETVNLFPLPNFGLKSHLHSIQYLFLAYLQGNIAICPTHAQRSIFGEKNFARQISEENPIVSQLVIIAAMPPFCQARIRTSEPVFIIFLQYIIIFLFVSSCSIPQPVPFGRVCFPPCLNSRFCSAQPHCVRFHTHRRLHFVLII